MKQRISSIDIVRGLIMIIMTLDHTRDFLNLPGPAPLDVPHTTVILFFTRWITHFCAPTFAFLSGVSAYLAGQRRSKGEHTAFLIKRGLWLILSDLLIISLIFGFDPQYHHPVLEVLWAIGCGMILLALLLRLPISVIAVISLALLFGRELIHFNGQFAAVFWGAKVAVLQLSTDRLVFVLYTVIPWVAPLLLGYCFGSLYRTGFAAEKRRKILMLSGLAGILLFIIIRFINQYGDPAPWAVQVNPVRTFLSFINTTKQAPSVLFIYMTLGPVMILLALTESIKNRIGEFCRVFGNVPYFYFILHLSVLRIINMILIPILGLPFKSDGSPIVWQAAGFGIPLWAVYLLWISVVGALYFVCRWYSNYKRNHKQWWLSYI